MKHCGVDAIAPGSPTSLRRFTEARGGIIGQLSVDRGQGGERGGGERTGGRWQSGSSMLGQCRSWSVVAPGYT